MFKIVFGLVRAGRTFFFSDSSISDDMMSSYPVTPLPFIDFYSTSILRPQAKVLFFTISGRGETLELTESKPF